MRFARALLTVLMVAVVSPQRCDEVTRILAREGEAVVRLGEIVAEPGETRVSYRGALDLDR